MSSRLETARGDADAGRRSGRDDALRFARVALPVPLGQVFTYRIPLSDAGEPALDVAPGARVVVEFGRSKRLGVVIGLEREGPPGLDPAKIKPITAVADQEPALPPELLGFLLEVARYYLAPVGEVLALCLPAFERALAKDVEAALGKKVRAVGRIVQVARAISPSGERTNLPRGAAAELLALLDLEGPLAVTTLVERFPSARAVVKRLAGLGHVAVDEVQEERDPFALPNAPRDVAPVLNAGQRRAVDAINLAQSGRKEAAFLLDGVTASGKTEVYLHAAEHALSLGRGVIILVPEIALTPQLVARFVARLGSEIAVLHSALGETARADAWRALRSGKLRIVVGARSALFSPVHDLGLIVVDEEHDGSFKQEEGVRYNARDMALLRAHRAGAVAVLGSATPSLASEALTQRGKLTRLVLTERARSAASLPEVEIVDLRRFGPGPSGDPLLSLPLHRALEKNLEAGGQSILFLNRRGFAPSLLCADCGTIFECPHCSVALTLHQSGRARLVCHYCDHQVGVPERCGACSSANLLEEGTGTERIESLLAESFPTARIARLDRDVASGQKSAAILDRVRRGEVDMLVGTQMVTKGHDLPSVTLVGVLNADAALSLPDFRASERTFHLLVQVAGRAGRADRPGRVLIQTRNPEHPAIVAAREHDVRAFVKREIELREELGYPPFSRLGLVRVDGPNESEVQREAARLSRLAEGRSDVEVLGPARAPLSRLRGRFRYQFLVRAAERGPLREALLLVARAGSVRGVRASIDVDPQSML